jgi:hypothetical protein
MVSGAYLRQQANFARQSLLRNQYPMLVLTVTAFAL